MTPLAIAIILSCQAVPIGVMTKQDNIQMNYRLVETEAGIDVQGMTEADSLDNFYSVASEAKLLGIKPEFIQQNGCGKAHP